MLYDRIVKQGTIDEPDGKPNPQFALPATVNWMRALRILAQDEDINFTTATAFYEKEGKRKMDPHVENTVLEQLLLGLHHLSALDQFRTGATASDFARVGVIAWYYGIANAASAMTVAECGSFQEDHAGTARLWDKQIASRGLAMVPFSWRVNNLIEKTREAEIVALRNGGVGDLLKRPASKAEALGAAAAYLSGSAAWYAWKTQEDLRQHQDFKALGVGSFRSKPARLLRDKWLARRSIGFVHQAIRYRGKANYREALFLAYGRSTEGILSGYVADLHAVLGAFLAMAGAYARRKLGKNLWSEFVADVDTNKAFTARASSIWS